MEYGFLSNDQLIAHGKKRIEELLEQAVECESRGATADAEYYLKNALFFEKRVKDFLANNR